MEKACARCHQLWEAKEDDPFITCPNCRIPAPKRKNKGGVHKQINGNPTHLMMGIVPITFPVYTKKTGDLAKPCILCETTCYATIFIRGFFYKKSAIYG